MVDHVRYIGDYLSTPTDIAASQEGLDLWKDPARFEVFEFDELAAGAKKLEQKFDDLRGVSSLWFGGDEDEGLSGNAFGRRAGRGGPAMFCDWRLDESMAEGFEDQIEATRSDKQVRYGTLIWGSLVRSAMETTRSHFRYYLRLRQAVLDNCLGLLR